MAGAVTQLRRGPDAARSNNVFTTHTSVPAGIDLFDVDLIREYFSDYCDEAGIGFDHLLALGRRDPGTDRRNRSPWPSAPSTRPRSATPSAVCIAAFRRNVARPVAEPSGMGSADHLDHQRRAPDYLA